MSQFTLQPENPRTPPAVPGLRANSVRTAIVRSYLWMTGGLLLTAAVAWLFAYSGWMEVVFEKPVVMILLVVAQFALVFGCSAAMKSASPALLYGMYIAYAILTGISLSSVFAVYTSSLIWSAFAISAAYFACLAAIGLSTRIDLDRIGMLCLIGLIVGVIAFVVMTLLGAPMAARLYAILGLLLFTGITAWDNQRLGRILTAADGAPIEQKKWSIYFALELYLDFINIFLYILRLVSAGSSSRS